MTEALKNLKDIKPNIQLHDYLFLLTVAVAVLLAAAALMFFLKKRKPDPHLEALKNLDFSDSKKTAYAFGEHARHFVDEKNKELFEEIQKELQNYKYKPRVAPLSKETVEKIKLFTGRLK